MFVNSYNKNKCCETLGGVGAAAQREAERAGGVITASILFKSKFEDKERARDLFIDRLRGPNHIRKKDIQFFYVYFSI